MVTSAQISKQLVATLYRDLIGPSWDDSARRHEQLNQPPSVRYTTGFLVPHVFQQEAGRPPETCSVFCADQGGEDHSKDAAINGKHRGGTAKPADSTDLKQVGLAI